MDDDVNVSNLSRGCANYREGEPSLLAVEIQERCFCLEFEGKGSHLYEKKGQWAAPELNF